MKIGRSKERCEDVVVTVRSADMEGDALFVYEKLIELVEKENRRRAKEGRKALGYTIQTESKEDWRAPDPAEPTQGDTKSAEVEENSWLSAYVAAIDLLKTEKSQTVWAVAVFAVICLATILIHVGVRIL